jgi:hypothetical protein
MRVTEPTRKVGQMQENQAVVPRVSSNPMVPNPEALLLLARATDLHPRKQEVAIALVISKRQAAQPLLNLVAAQAIPRLIRLLKS